MDTIIAHVTEWYQLGKEHIEAKATPHLVWIPKHWTGERTMPTSDVTVHAKGSCSARYQSVHFGVEIKVKDIPFEEVEEYQNTLQNLCFHRLDDMEPEAQKMLSSLVSNT